MYFERPQGVTEMARQRRANIVGLVIFPGLWIENYEGFLTSTSQTVRTRACRVLSGSCTGDAFRTVS